jgi:predicted lipoprotein with Yx(FWY)xxD motif
MLTNDRSTIARAALPRPWLLATAAGIATLAALAFVLVHPTAGNAAQAKGTTVSTATTGLGRILVTANGHALYLFEKDKNSKSACTGMCATAWPPLITSGKPIAGTGTKASLLGTTKRADGRLQVTYNHHPVYTFIKDTKKGQTTGENLDAFGAEWYAISPAGIKVEKATNSSATTTSPSSGGGGY